MLVQTGLGKIKGRASLLWDGIQVFLGIPFAHPPVGSLRWKPPQRLPGWSGVLDASRYPNRCLQPDFPAALADVPMQGVLSEDCLYLNVWAPEPDGRKRPVLFYIHGGGYAAGSANDLDPSHFALQQDVVVVAANYRLGNFGFFDLSSCSPEYSGSGALGFLDQILALRWVRDHIDDFGGNPDNVTLIGCSAGGGSVLTLQAAPAANGLFHKGIALSPGEIFSARMDIGAAQAAYLGMHKAEFLDYALKLSSEEVFGMPLQLGTGALACVDGEVIKSTAAKAIAENPNPIPMVIGSCKDEGRLLTPMVAADAGALASVLEGMCAKMGGAPYRSYLQQTFGDGFMEAKMTRLWDDYFRGGVVRNAEACALAGGQVWVFNFDVPTEHVLGTTHASDLPFVFNLFPEDRPLITFHDRDDPSVREIAQSWSNTLGAFVRSGTPRDATLPSWPRYDLEQRLCLQIERDYSLVIDPDAERRPVFELAERVVAN